MTSKRCIFCKDKNALSELSLKIPSCKSCLDLALNEFYIKYQCSHEEIKTGNTELDEYRIGFGKNRGKKILDVKSDYIKWCLENFEGLRDIEIFQAALKSLTGEHISSPVALKVTKKTLAGAVAGEIKADTEDFPF